MIRVTRPQNSSNGSRNGAGSSRWSGSSDAAGNPLIPSIPLTEDVSGTPGEQSIGGLVKDATTHLSTLVRSEVELAKLEITAEVKKGVKGSVFFIVALTVLLFSLFFFFFAIAELLADVGLYRSAAFGIVFGAMLLFAGLFAFLGYRKIRKIRAPERTIAQAKETAKIGERLRRHEDDQLPG